MQIITENNNEKCVQILNEKGLEKVVDVVDFDVKNQNWFGFWVFWFSYIGNA